MNLVVLGSGTSVPHKHRSSAAYWITTESGTLLLDISPDAAHRMAQEELEWANLDAIWISHFHLDHVGGLAPFLFSVKWAPQTQNRRKTLRIFGPRGLTSLVKAFDDAHHYRLLEPPFPVELMEVEPGQHLEIFSGLKATTWSTPHNDESLALRLTDASGKTVVYSSDTGFSQQFADFARDASLLILECSFRKDKPVDTHLELAEAMQIVSESNPRTAMLIHLYPEWDNWDLSAEAQKFWPGRTIEAVDGLRLEI